jgi:hypothetical protein
MLKKLYQYSAVKALFQGANDVDDDCFLEDSAWRPHKPSLNAASPHITMNVAFRLGHGGAEANSARADSHSLVSDKTSVPSPSVYNTSKHVRAKVRIG